LQQYAAGQVFLCFYVLDGKFDTLQYKIFDIFQGDVFADFGIVKPPVGVFFDDSHGS
jgi:hypothetical protein